MKSTAARVPVDEPLPTVTTRDRFALVVPDALSYGLDIRFRMLQPRELAAAMGFPSDYEFAGNKTETTKQIGNAVPVNLATVADPTPPGDGPAIEVRDYSVTYAENSNSAQSARMIAIRVSFPSTENASAGGRHSSQARWILSSPASRASLMGEG